MKYIQKKLIKGNTYYYFEYYFRLGKKQYRFSRYLGSELPNNLKEKLMQYFNEIAVFALEKLQVQNYFLEENLKHIEHARFQYTLLNHNLFKKELKLFQTLFYILFVLNSNRAEGSKVTLLDIEKIITRKSKPRTMIDWEIVNSIDAINFAFSDEMKWNAKNIKKIHKLMFKEVYPTIAGEYKKVNNIVNNSRTTNWKEVPKEMKAVLAWLQQNKKKMYPPQLALEFHWRFEDIHPFEDGNGRVGRVLLNALLVGSGYAPVIYFSQNHRAYCNAIASAIQGSKRALAKHYVQSVKKSRNAIDQYKKKEIIKGGSSHVGKWEIQKGKIRIN